MNNLIRAKFGKTIFYLGKFELGISCLSLVIMTLSYGLEIISRFFAGISVVFVQEISMVCWVWLVFTAAPYTFKNKGFIVIEFIYKRLPQKIQFIVGIFVYFLTMVFCYFVVKESIVYFKFQSNTTTEIIDLPVNLFLIPVIFAAVSIFLTSIYDVLNFWKTGNHQQINET